MKLLRISLLPMLLILFSCNQTSKENQVLPESPNFLVFFIDDLRPELGCYGMDQIHSPNIDALAADGLQFNRAYCNVPVCGASRASLMSGVRPTPQRFVTYFTEADKDLPGHISLPGYFKQNGYQTISYGKIFHHETDSKSSWTEPAWRAASATPGNWRDYVTKKGQETAAADNKGPSWEIAIDAPDSIYMDGRVATKAIRKLGELSKSDQPFMLWVGFTKPHLPFNAPSKYWDLYDPDEIDPATNPERSPLAPIQSFHNSGELRGYSDIHPSESIQADQAKILKHGYYASVSYTDALVGQVMAELERLDLDENTVVAIFGDHGWNLGEHDLWCKHCNYNTSLQVPLIIKVPGVTKGQTTEGLTEFIDLYPTFTELAGLDYPEWTDGKSLLPLIDNPDTEWTEPVYTRYVLGNSVVTEDFIYTEYMRSRNDCTIIANMLYDHRVDPDEINNLAQDEEYLPLIDSLSSMLQEVHFGRKLQ